MTGSVRKSNLATRLLPFPAWLPSVNRDTVRGDLMAGLTGAIAVLPQGVAFATITGIYQHLDKSVCANCDRRIFGECGPAPN